MVDVAKNLKQANIDIANSLGLDVIPIPALDVAV